MSPSHVTAAEAGAGAAARASCAHRHARVLLAAAAAGTAAFAVHALTGAGGATAHDLLAVWLRNGIAVLAVVICAWRAWAVPEDRASWAAAAVGLALWAAGTASHAHGAGDRALLVAPSAADWLALGVYPAMYVAIARLARARGALSGPPLWLDGIIGGAATAAVGAELVLEPVINADAHQSMAGAIVGLAHPVGDVTLLGMLLAVVVADGAWRAGPALLAAGMAVFAAADATYVVRLAGGAYAPGDLLDGAWQIALLLAALGATMPARRPLRPRAPAPRRALIPGVAGAVALIVLALLPLTDRNVASLALASLTLLLVLARLVGSLHQVEALLVARARDATTDALTGLGNRRMLLDDLAAAGADATPERPVLVAMFDLDGFKVYNDTFGHPAGDALLVRIGAALRAAAGRARGRAYRIGGDEFCALVPLADGDPPATRSAWAPATASPSRRATAGMPRP